MPKEQKSPHHYPHGESQLNAGEDFLTRPVLKALEQATNAGRSKTRLLLKINLYEPPHVRGASGRYVSWSGMRWKHDVGSVAEGQHFVKTLDRFVQLYQQDPMAMEALLKVQDFSGE